MEKITAMTPFRVYIYLYFYFYRLGNGPKIWVDPSESGNNFIFELYIVGSPILCLKMRVPMEKES